MKFQRSVLGNGLRILTIPMPSFESVTVLVMVNAGSRFETKRNNGISHFLEHMAFKGTKKRPSAIEISSLIDGIGGEFNAFTGKETTGFYIKSSSNHLDLSLDVLSDMLNNSLLNPKEIDKERGVILEEINLYEDTPARKIGDIYERLLYGDTPMGWDIAGEKDVIKKIQKEDFLSYMKSLYSADNITVVVAGGINSKKATELIEKYFGKMSKFATLRYKKVVEDQKKPKVFLKQKKTEQAHIMIGFRTVPLEHKDHFALELEDSRAVAGFYGSQELLEKKIDSPEEIIEKIKKVTLEEVQAAAKRYFVNNGLNLAAIGNFADGQRFEKLLHL